MVSIPSVKVLKTLTCAECGKFLSIGPVRFKEDGSNICGRCLINKEGVNHKLTAAVGFEFFLKELLFHCSYYDKGCNRVFEWNSAMEHEMICQRRIYKCPALPENSCTWQDTSDKLKEHFNAEHKALLLNESNFVLQLDQDSKTNQLLCQSDELFLIHSKVSLQENLLMIGIRYVGVRELADNFEYSFELTNSKPKNEQSSIISMTSKSKRTSNDDSLSLDESAAICINIQQLTQLLDCANPNIVIFNVSLKCLDNKRTPTPVPANSLVQCKWPQCYKIVFHDSIAMHESECDKRTTSCTWPGCSYSKSSGNVKEHAAQCEMKTVPCKWPGCSQQVRLKEVANHRDCCLHRDRRAYRCKIRECDWAGEQIQMGIHYKSQHPHRYYENESVTIGVGFRKGFRWCMQAHGERFRCWYGVDEEAEVVRAIYIGPDSLASRYQVIVEILVGGCRKKESVHFEGECNNYGQSAVNIILGDCNEYAKSGRLTFNFKIVVKS